MMRPSTEVVGIPTGDLGFVGTASFDEEWVLPYPVVEMSASSTFYRSAVKFLGSVTPSVGTVGSVGKSLGSGTRFSRSFGPADMSLLKSRSLVLPRDLCAIPRLPGDSSLTRTVDRRPL